jgi:hypothetical protein
MGNVAEQLERSLGPIEAGWSEDADGNPIPFQIARFDHVPIGGVAYATIGLGRFPARSRTSGKLVRLELLLLVHADQAAGPFPSILQQVASQTVLSGHALLRGDVLGPRGPLVSGSPLEALYVTAPVYFPDHFATATERGDPVVIAWLVPVSRKEAEFIADRGWSAFEDLLVEIDPDLTDMGRKSMLL